MLYCPYLIYNLTRLPLIYREYGLATDKESLAAEREDD